MLFLVDVAEQQRFATFEEHCYLRNLAPTTALTYWISFMSVTKILQPQSDNPTEARILKILKSRAIRFPVGFPVALTEMHLSALLKRFPLRPSAPIIILTVRRGKCMMHNPPYLLVIPDGPLGSCVLHLQSTARNAGRLFLWTTMNTPSERAVVKQQVAATLIAIDDTLELRSVRRGGLQRMAALGYTLEVMLLFSRHKSTDMLLRYLNWGAASTTMVDQMSEVATQMLNMDSRPASPHRA
jgi:hypothetical protein